MGPLWGRAVGALQWRVSGLFCLLYGPVGCRMELCHRQCVNNLKILTEEDVTSRAGFLLLSD